MPYAPKRRSITKKQRAAILAKTDGTCYLCHLPILPTETWDADHELARELGGSDDISNLFPAHKACHTAKTKQDIKLIAKGNRLRRKFGLALPSKRRKKQIPQRAGSKWPSRKIAGARQQGFWQKS